MMNHGGRRRTMAAMVPYQLRGGTLLSGETKDDKIHRDSDAHGVPDGILSKNVGGVVALR